MGVANIVPLGNKERLFAGMPKSPRITPRRSSAPRHREIYAIALSPNSTLSARGCGGDLGATAPSRLAGHRAPSIAMPVDRGCEEAFKAKLVSFGGDSANER